MHGPTYPAAHTAAPRIHARLIAHAEDARARGYSPIASMPSTDDIEAIISAAFWASLRREEGYSPRISLAFLSPHETTGPMLFERPLALEAAPLTRVAPAVERAGIHLGVWADHGELTVWGTTRSIPATCFVVEVFAPGLLVVKHHRGAELGKFVNVAVLEGDQIKIVDQSASVQSDYPELMASLVGFDVPRARSDAGNVLVQLAVSMRAHGRGGVLLVVPTGSEMWRESIVRPIAYAVSPPFSELAALCGAAPDERGRREWREAMARAVSTVAGLTAVDGATVMTTGYDLLAFGAKIARRKGSPQIEQVSVTEPIEGALHDLVDPARLGGTRHLSAAQFVHDQQDALALVASQDGRFTVCTWSRADGLVHAHRVEALLL